MKRNPVVWVMSILGTLQLIAGGAAISDLMGAKWTAVAVLVLAAVQLGVQGWVRGQVTPLADPRDNLGRALHPGPID